MARRRLVLVIVLLLVLALIGVGVWFIWQPERSLINEENVAKIRLGMACAEVETLLGEPGTRLGFQDDLGVRAYWGMHADDKVIPPGAWIAWWRSDEFGVEVLFDQSGVVQDKHGWPVEQESLREMVRRHLRRWLCL